MFTPSRTPAGRGVGRPKPEAARLAKRPAPEAARPANGREYREAAGAGINGNCPFEGARKAKAALAGG